MWTPRPASAFKAAGSVATSVLPSPVFISAIFPSWRTMPPINCTSKWRMLRWRRPASRVRAKVCASAGSKASARRRRYAGSSRSTPSSRCWTSALCCAIRSRSWASLRLLTSGSRALMAATTGAMRLTSRSCLVPMNRAITLSITWSTCMSPFRGQFEIQLGQPGEDGEPLRAPQVTDGANPRHFDVWRGANDSFYPVRRTVRKAAETMRGRRVLQAHSEPGFWCSVGRRNGCAGVASVSRGRQCAKGLAEEMAKLVKLVQTHAHNFESHVLGAVIPHERPLSDASQARLKAQTDLCAGLDVMVRRSHSPAQADGLDFHAAIASCAAGYGGHTRPPAAARLAPLARPAPVR